MTLLINLIGLFLIALVIWWFWIAKPTQKQIAAKDRVTIYVKDGTYSPSFIKARKGKPLHLTFIRKDPTPCAEIVLFATLDISAALPLNKACEIIIPTDKAGEFEFCCQMGMYRGKVVVTE